ncbi:MAG TPA: helix-turn-helix transcriptional regulator [Gammaproteobacteria bacterium]|nr:helix-turn-helix transcriptional regulator [Gammaproteobacteria bacterium]
MSVATHPYYAAVETFLAEQKVQITPRLIDFPAIEAEARKILADNLCLSRKSVNLSQSSMARIFGISLSQYKKYESGREVLRIDLAQKWALRFSRPVFYLLQGSGYGRYLAGSDGDDRFEFIWFLANSLTDEYFSKLIDLLCLFTQKAPFGKRPEPSGITHDMVKEVIDEIETKMYIAIAYGMQAVRKWFGYSQEQFAELMGISLSTYQQYEKPTMKPRFNIFFAARCVISMGINPLVTIAGTRFARIRHMQNARMALIREVVAGIGPEQLERLRPLIKGFAETVKQIPGALIVDV